MKAWLAIALMIPYLTSCGPKIVPAKPTEPLPQKPEYVPVMDIVQAALSPTGKHCGSTERGSDVYVDSTVECPEIKYVDVQQNIVHRDNRPVKPGDWTDVAIFFTMDKIDCGGVDAMGCTTGFTNGTVISVISLYFPWRKGILRHELTHAVYLLRRDPEMRHFCLDNPDSIACE